MQHASVLRIGGPALVLGAALYVVSLFVHPIIDTAEALAAVDMDAWTTAHWLASFAAVFTLGGLLALARTFAGGDGEGWAILGSAAAAVGVIALISIGGTEGAAIAAGEAGTAPFESATANVIMWQTIAWLGIAGLGAAMLAGGGWPAWLGWGGVAVGLVMAAAGATVGGDVALTRIVFLLGFLWLAATGALMARAARPAPEQAATPETPPRHEPAQGGYESSPFSER